MKELFIETTCYPLPLHHTTHLHANARSLEIHHLVYRCFVDRFISVENFCLQFMFEFYSLNLTT